MALCLTVTRATGGGGVGAAQRLRSGRHWGTSDYVVNGTAPARFRTTWYVGESFYTVAVRPTCDNLINHSIKPTGVVYHYGTYRDDPKNWIGDDRDRQILRTSAWPRLVNVRLELRHRRTGAVVHTVYRQVDQA